MSDPQPRVTEPAEACPWPVDTACFNEEWDDLTPDVQERSLLLASATLYRLTGRRVGGCPVTIRPCKASCAGGASAYFAYGSYGWMNPHIGVSGEWVNSCGCNTDCSCTVLCEVELPQPVGEIFEVKVDGVVISPTDYRLDNNRLVWVGATDCPWPACQDMTKPDTEPGTFSVEYLNSYPVGAIGAYAGGILAMEFAKACIGNKCRLPSTVTSLSRQGVSFELAVGSFPGGYTGIREVDAFIAMWNPGNLTQQTQVWTPDLRTPRVMR